MQVADAFKRHAFGLFVFVFVFVFWSHQVMLKTYSWLCTQESFFGGVLGNQTGCCGLKSGRPQARQVSIPLSYARAPKICIF